MGTNTNTAPLPHWSPTIDVGTKIATMVLGELQVAMLMVLLLVVLNRGEVTLLHPMMVGCGEEKLAGKSMAPTGSLQITGVELHMVVMRCTMKSSQITTMSMLRWWMMSHIPLYGEQNLSKPMCERESISQNPTT